MESRKENNDKRRRKTIARPVLVRSEKPGQVASADYGRQRPEAPFWKAA